MRPIRLPLLTISLLLAVISTSCRGNSLSSTSVESTESKPTVTVTRLVSPSSTPADTAEAIPACTEIGQSWTSPTDGVTLVCVPAGEFLMGAADDDSQAKKNERPQHRVYLDAFWIDRTEVTNANYARCIADGACQPEIYEDSASTYIPYAVHPEYQDFPALVYESDVAAAYCHWAGRRLPTEAEWEKAARGTDGRRYPWGDGLDCSQASYSRCDNISTSDDPPPPRCGNSAHCRTTGVDDHPAGASPYGVLNMAGNVWEWVADWYGPDYYASSPSSNPAGPEEGRFRVRRGGGTKSLAQDLRVTARASGSPHHYFDGQMGFRCAVSAPGVESPG